MKTKLIIVEGMDNTGKTTLINRLEKTLVNSTETPSKVKIIHLTKPPKDIPKDEIESYMNTYYDTITSQLLDNHIISLYDYIILDRGYLSEYVYGPLYRNRNELDITVNNLIYEKKLINFYKDNVILILLNSTSNTFLKNNEDNESLSNINDKNINDKLLNIEREKFFEGFENSIICNKKLYNVNKSGNELFKDVLPEIIKDFFL